MNKKLLLMTVHHKNDPIIEISKKYFFPIQAGKELSNVNLGINVDNEGDNISIKNKMYCELTACYSAWKNFNFEYIGLMHYRRIFTERNFISKKSLSKFKYYIKNIYYCFDCKDLNHRYSNLIRIKNKKDVEKISNSFYAYLEANLLNYDIYLPKKISFKYLNLEQQFRLSHNTDDWLLFKKLINEYYPFLTESLETISKSRSFYAYNMFIMKKDIFDKYMDILFDLLFKMEAMVNLKNKTLYQRRLYGFLAERFLNIYVHYLLQDKSIRLKELNTVFLDFES